MGQDSIDRVLETKRPAAPEQAAETDADKFYSVLGGDGLQEHFLELRFRNGLRTCFSYTDLMWFNYDPEAGCIDLEFGGFLLTLKGRGLGDALFNGIKQKRVAWVKEADVEMQDHSGNKSFIKEITITPPESSASKEESASV
jgi:hypothetical protein